MKTNSTHSSTLPQAFENYMKWTPTAWTPSENRQYDDLTGRFVAATGLSGESGEVIEALLTGDEQSICKEFGDAFYYWSVICTQNHFSSESFDIVEAVGVSSKTALDVSSARIRRLAQLHYTAQLAMAQGQVAESLKKDVRGDAGESQDKALEMRQQLYHALAYFLVIWLQGVSKFTQSSVEEIWAQNRAKVEDRKVRGVLLGSGDER